MKIELYGTARLRAGKAEVALSAGSLGAALADLAAACPSLSGSVVIGEAIHPAFRLSLNGERFVSDPDTPLREGDCLLLISADAGG